MWRGARTMVCGVWCGDALILKTNATRSMPSLTVRVQHLSYHFPSPAKGEQEARATSGWLTQRRCGKSPGPRPKADRMRRSTRTDPMSQHKTGASCMICDCLITLLSDPPIPWYCSS